MKKDVLICACNSTEHQIVLHLDQEDKVIYCHIHLTSYQSFFKRLWVGIKYIFGYKCKYGHWDEFIINHEHSDKLIELGQKIKLEKND